MAFQVPEDTRQKQASASHPDNSAWVSANAGSGKTFVLARRVIRLLLAGTEPSRILCLTFTKAAAAEMSNRVFRELSGWTELTDEELRDNLTDLEGYRPSEAMLQRARRLFARALETPGGLKIQTIHAFAERLLHQFPVEANVPVQFEILDDQLATELTGTALANVLRAARLGLRKDWTAALALLIDHLSDMDIQSALVSLIRDRESFGRFIESSEVSVAGAGKVGLEAALANLANALGIEAEDSLEALENSIPFGPYFPAGRISQLAPLFDLGGKRDKEQAGLMRAILGSQSTAEQAQLWISLFRKKDGAAKTSSYMASKKTQEADLGLAEAIEQEQARLDTLFDKKNALLTHEVSRALFTLAEGVVSHYQRAKAARGLMDFDDLIIKAADLLKPVNAAAWVHYKLDQGIDHILVDEAQDTNPRQWEIIRQLGEEFFSGEGARNVNRTIFAVGDEKQSIYSFQGAEPKCFAEMRRHFESRAKEADKPFQNIKLSLSFRSTPHVLKSVDAVFSTSTAYEALSSDKEKTVHEPIRHRDPGLVEVWPLYEPVAPLEEEDWAKPLDAQGETSAPVRLARTIAKTIRHWCETGEMLAGSGRAIRPGDVLVLVRKRGNFVTAINRALKEEGVPVAGADRLALLDHIAVMDLLALGDVMLLPEDDLSLASVLKSPLFGMDEERLLDLAYFAGGRSRSLWDTLRLRAEAKDPADADLSTIFSELSDWQGQIDFQPPFDFFSHILGPGGRRKAFIERLGPEADEVMDELLSRALDFEKSQTPNLQAFLAAMRQGGAEIKRDMGAAEGQVRVMTVHGAKGLEAPVVFLIDSTGKPVNASHHPHLVHLPAQTETNGLMVWKAPSASQPAPVSKSLAELDAQAEAEYLRLLYVGMTRAEDRLYLCGYRGKTKPAENCWHEAARRALSERFEDVEHPLTGEIIHRWQLDGAFEAKDTARPSGADETIPQTALPVWFASPAPPPPSYPTVLQPSRAAEKIEQDQSSNFGSSFLSGASPVLAWEPRRRGLLIHALIEHLPQLPPEQWHKAGRGYLDRVGSDMPHAAREALLLEVLALLEEDTFGDLFGQNSQAEVSLAGWVEMDGISRPVSGTIDRLVVKSDSVVIVDYKTNRSVPLKADDAPLAYCAQLALYAELLRPLYPEKSIQTLLLWTAAPRLMPICERLRQSTLAKFKINSKFGP